METKHTLTNSSLTTLKTCPRKYQYQYEMGYSPVRESEALIIGKMFHAGAEAWIVNGRDLTSAQEAVRVEYLKANIVDDYLLVKVLAMIEGYHNQYQNEPYELVHAEVEFTMPLVNPETTEEAADYSIAGKMDRIVKPKEKTRLLLLETKTVSEDIENPSSDYWRKLNLDSQISTYMVGSAANGMRVESCLYDVIRKPLLRPKKNETPDEYYQRLREDIANNPSYYYARREIARSGADLTEWMKDTWQYAEVLDTYRSKNKFPRNTSACTGNYGKCHFFDVCSGQTNLDDQTKYQKNEAKHRELSLAVQQ